MTGQATNRMTGRASAGVDWQVVQVTGSILSLAYESITCPLARLITR